MLLRHGDDGFGVARDSVAHVAAFEADETDAAFGHPAEVTEEELVGVGAAGVDFHAGVTALETADGELIGHHALGCFLGFVGDGESSVDTAGAADVEFALGLGVEVEEVVAVELAFLQAEGTGHASLLVGGDEGLEGSVLDSLAGENSHDGGYAHAVVGTESGVASIHPVTDNLGLDGVFFEVVLLAGTGLGHHVHVGLQNDGMDFFHALGGGLAENDIANGVDTAGYFVLFGPVDKEFAHFPFMLRGARLTGKRVEVFPQLFGCEVFNCFCCHSCFYFRLIFFLLKGKCKGTNKK